MKCRIDNCNKTLIDDRWSTCEEHSRCVALDCIARRTSELDPFCATHAQGPKLVQAWNDL